MAPGTGAGMVDQRDPDEPVEPPVGSETDPVAPARQEEPERAPRPVGETYGEAAEEQVGDDDDG